MYIEGTIKQVFECPYKEKEMWCELEIETFDHQLFTVMIPTDVYKTTKKELLKEGIIVHVTGTVLESSKFAIAWHISLKKGFTQELALEI